MDKNERTLNRIHGLVQRSITQKVAGLSNRKLEFDPQCAESIADRGTKPAAPEAK